MFQQLLLDGLRSWRIKAWMKKHLNLKREHHPKKEQSCNTESKKVMKKESFIGVVKEAIMVSNHHSRGIENETINSLRKATPFWNQERRQWVRKNHGSEEQWKRDLKKANGSAMRIWMQQQCVRVVIAIKDTAFTIPVTCSKWPGQEWPWKSQMKICQWDEKNSSTLSQPSLEMWKSSDSKKIDWQFQCSNEEGTWKISRERGWVKTSPDFFALCSTNHTVPVTMWLNALVQTRRDIVPTADAWSADALRWSQQGQFEETARKCWAVNKQTIWQVQETLKDCIWAITWSGNVAEFCNTKNCSPPAWQENFAAWLSSFCSMNCHSECHACDF